MCVCRMACSVISDRVGGFTAPSFALLAVLIVRLKSLSERRRAARLPVRRGEHQVVPIPAQPLSHALFGLPAFVLSQFLDHTGGQGDSAPAPLGLRGFEPSPCLGLFQDLSMANIKVTAGQIKMELEHFLS